MSMYTLMRYTLVASVLAAAYALGLAVYLVPYAWLVPAGIGVAALCKKTYRLSAHGTARWADASDMPHLLEGNGLILGHVPGKPSKLRGLKDLFDSRLSAKEACQTFLLACQRKQPEHLVRLNDAVHTALFAPTGVGKGVSCVIPYLLTSPESCVVVDFKGENARLTADARRKMGHKVVILDPYKVVTGTPDTFNPLGFIDADSPTAIDDCRDLAESLVVRTGQEKEPHWNDSAETWLGAMAATVVAFAEQGDKSLQAVRSLLTNPQKMEAAIKLMCESNTWEGMLSRMGHQLTQFKEKELASTLTTTNRHLRFLDTLAVAASTKGSSFDPAGLRTGKMTIYLVLPPEHMRTQSALLRLWIGALLRAVVRGGLQEKTKTHFILDEAASLGHMASLDDAVDKFRGYGIRLQLYYQSLGQLKLCWPEGRDLTLLSNVSQVFFGVNEKETAQYVSDRLGEGTIVVESGGTSSSESRSVPRDGDANTSYSTSRNSNWNQMGRRLLKPEEVTGLDPRIAVTFTPGVPPIWTRLVRYYEPDFNRSRGTGTAKAIVDTACLLLVSVVLAVFFTAALLSHTFE